MKKIMCMLLALLLCVPALAEDTAIPVRLAEPTQGQASLETVLARALAALPVQPEQYQPRAELVEMSDGSFRWVVTVFDLVSLSNGWCMELDAVTGEITASYTTYDGYFMDVYECWAAHKGSVQALWAMEDKALFDALYALQPVYGVPAQGDMAADDALAKALTALGLQSADGYMVCYGYLMGGEGYNGILEVCLSADGVSVSHRVNLDAVTGEIYYLESADNGNG